MNLRRSFNNQIPYLKNYITFINVLLVKYNYFVDYIHGHLLVKWYFLSGSNRISEGYPPGNTQFSDGWGTSWGGGRCRFKSTQGKEGIEFGLSPSQANVLTTGLLCLSGGATSCLSAL